MSSIKTGSARAVANLDEGSIVATVELTAPAKRVFQALASPEITKWWVRPGVFDTREWSCDVRPGGSWRASGIGGGRAYTLEGEFVEVDAPRGLVHTWRSVAAPGTQTTVAYAVEPIDGGTRVTLRHSGFTKRETCENTAIGWETSFERLAELLSS